MSKRMIIQLRYRKLRGPMLVGCFYFAFYSYEHFNLRFAESLLWKREYQSRLGFIRMGNFRKRTNNFLPGQFTARRLLIFSSQQHLWKRRWQLEYRLIAFRNLLITCIKFFSRMYQLGWRWAICSLTEVTIITKALSFTILSIMRREDERNLVLRCFGGKGWGDNPFGL